MPTASEKWRQTGFDADEAQRSLDNEFRTGAFDYQKTRDTVADEQWGDQFQLQLDQFSWDKNPDNPAQRGMILQNQISDLELKALPDLQKVQLAQLKQDLSTGAINQSLIKANIANIIANTANTKKNTKLMGTKSSGSGGSRSGGSSGGSSGSSSNSINTKWETDKDLLGKQGDIYSEFKSMSTHAADKSLNARKGELTSMYGFDGDTH